jgi:hypothetical protein
VRVRSRESKTRFIDGPFFVQADRSDDAAIALYSGLGQREDVLHFDLPVADFSGGPQGTPPRNPPVRQPLRMAMVFAAIIGDFTPLGSHR